MWNLSWPGIEPTFPALAGRFLFTAPPGKSCPRLLTKKEKKPIKFASPNHLPEKAMATHSSTLAWRSPWTEEPGRLQSMGLWRVQHKWATSLSRIGEGNGNPLQCSCMVYPRDGRAWWAAIYGVEESQTWLKRLSSGSNHLPGGNFQSEHRKPEFVTERVWWVWLLATQKPINRPGWLKGSWLYFRCWQLGGWGEEAWVVDICPKANSTLPTPNKQGVRAFIDRGGQGGSTCRNSTVISNSHL